MAGRGQAPSRPRNMRHTLRVLLDYMGHARTRLAVVAVLVTVSGLANLLGTYMIKPVVNAVGAGDFSRFSRLVALTACIYAVGVASAVGYTQTMVRAAQKVVFDIRRDLLAHIEGLPLSFFDSTRHGDVMSYFTNDVDTVSEALNNSFASAVQALIQTVGTFTLLVVLDWRLTLITLACDVLIACYVRFSGGRSRRYFGAQQATLGQLDGYVEEMMAGQKVVKVFNHEDASQADFDGLNEALRQSGTTAQAYASTMVPVTVAVSYMNFAVVCVVGALLALGGRADVGSLASYLVFVRQACMPINQLTQQRKELQAKQKEQQKTINNLRSKKASVVDQKAALDQENDLAQQEIEVVKQQITAYDQQIEDKGVELEEAKQEEEAQTVRFRGCVRHLEEYGQMSYIAILLEATSLSDLLARMDMVGEVIAYNKQVQADMTAAREKVETVKAELEDARTELQDKQSELETKQVELQQKVSEANALLASLESDINAYKSVYDQYEQQQQNVQSQIDKQVEDLRRQEEANKKNDPSYDAGKDNGATGSMMWPCPSCHTITSEFGWRYHPIYHTQKYHSGVDIGASYGASIVAADGGTVITAGAVSGYGNCVVINHGNGITTLYGHMSSIAVSSGQKVSKGQTIGYVGSTGNSTGPHLHWEVTVNGVRQNPLNYAR